MQGEGGLEPRDKRIFLLQLQKLCNDNKVMLISDEIQAGMGRMGTLCSRTPILVMNQTLSVLAKGIGGGFPVGAFMAKKEISSPSLKPATTVQPTAVTRLGTAVMSMPLCPNWLNRNFLEHVSKKPLLTFREQLTSLARMKQDDAITAIKGEGSDDRAGHKV